MTNCSINFVENSKLSLTSLVIIVLIFGFVTQQHQILYLCFEVLRIFFREMSRNFKKMAKQVKSTEMSDFDFFKTRAFELNLTIRLTCFGLPGLPDS